MKYRIKKILNSRYEEMYIVQSKFLFFFWVNRSNSRGEFLMMYNRHKTKEEAIKLLEKLKKNDGYKSKTIKDKDGSYTLEPFQVAVENFNPDDTEDWITISVPIKYTGPVKEFGVDSYKEFQALPPVEAKKRTVSAIAHVFNHGKLKD